jgi:hypothetical protein
MRNETAFEARLAPDILGDVFFGDFGLPVWFGDDVSRGYRPRTTVCSRRYPVPSSAVAGLSSPELIIVTGSETQVTRNRCVAPTSSRLGFTSAAEQLNQPIWIRPAALRAMTPGDEIDGRWVGRWAAFAAQAAKQILGGHTALTILSAGARGKGQNGSTMQAMQLHHVLWRWRGRCRVGRRRVGPSAG